MHRLVGVAFLLIAGCGGAPGDGLAVDLDKSNEATLLRYYLGGYAAAEGADPVAAGLLVEDGGWRIRPDAFPEPVRASLTDTDGDGTLGWDEFVAFVEATYAEARALPATLGGIRAAAPYADGDSAWFVTEVDGVMTAARRRIFVPVAALRAALDAFAETGDLVYPEGTVIVGEHRAEDAVLETTVKRRRADGFWDFAVYGPDGNRAAATQTEPRPLRAPIQCVGCHLGRRLFDPEKSFPAAAPDGPYGPRAIYASDAVRAAVEAHDLVDTFDEHGRRTDGVLGLYATLYAAQLLTDRDAGRHSDEDAALLDRLGL